MGWQDPLRCSGYVDALGGIERLIPAVLIRCPSLRSLCAHLKVNIRPALVVLPAGSADAILLRVFH